MKFIVKTKQSDGTEHWEEFEEDLPDITTVRKWVIDLVNNFNLIFQPIACKREFIDVEIIKLEWNMCKSCSNYGCKYNMSVDAIEQYYECAKMRTEAEKKLDDKDKEIYQLKKELKEQEETYED